MAKEGQRKLKRKGINNDLKRVKLRKDMALNNGVWRSKETNIQPLYQGKRMIKKMVNEWVCCCREICSQRFLSVGTSDTCLCENEAK